MIGSLLEGTRQSVGLNCGSQAILDVAGFVDEGELAKALVRISERFPILHGQVARDWMNLAPYWRVPRYGAEYVPRFALRVVDLREGETDKRSALLVEHANKPFDSESQHLRFLLVRIGKNIRGWGWISIIGCWMGLGRRRFSG